MAKKKDSQQQRDDAEGTSAQRSVDETPDADLTPEEIYNKHNHPTAQADDAAKQCQCPVCKTHRGE
jgi:hypothetical protein